MVIADVLKRWQQLQGCTAVLCTGTDEHGMKIQQAALAANTPPKQFCDSGAEVFKVSSTYPLHLPSSQDLTHHCYY